MVNFGPWEKRWPSWRPMVRLSWSSSQGTIKTPKYGKKGWLWGLTCRSKLLMHLDLSQGAWCPDEHAQQLLYLEIKNKDQRIITIFHQKLHLYGFLSHFLGIIYPEKSSPDADVISQIMENLSTTVAWNQTPPSPPFFPCRYRRLLPRHRYRGRVRRRRRRCLHRPSFAFGCFCHVVSGHLHACPVVGGGGVDHLRVAAVEPAYRLRLRAKEHRQEHLRPPSRERASPEVRALELFAGDGSVGFPLLHASLIAEEKFQAHSGGSFGNGRRPAGVHTAWMPLPPCSSRAEHRHISFPTPKCVFFFLSSEIFSFDFNRFGRSFYQDSTEVRLNTSMNSSTLLFWKFSITTPLIRTQSYCPF